MQMTSLEEALMFAKQFLFEGLNAVAVLALVGVMASTASHSSGRVPEDELSKEAKNHNSAIDLYMGDRDWWGYAEYKALLSPEERIKERKSNYYISMQLVLEPRSYGFEYHDHIGVRPYQEQVIDLANTIARCLKNDPDEIESLLKYLYVKKSFIVSEVIENVGQKVGRESHITQNTMSSLKEIHKRAGVFKFQNLAEAESDEEFYKNVHLDEDYNEDQ
jgi:hypothetical protein